jgi:hypothetical protein
VRIVAAAEAEVELVELGTGFSSDGFKWFVPRGGGPNNAFIPSADLLNTWNGYHTKSAGGAFLVVGDQVGHARVIFVRLGIEAVQLGNGSAGICRSRSSVPVALRAGAKITSQIGANNIVPFGKYFAMNQAK